MAKDSPDIFAEIARIEKEADAVLHDARAEAERIREETERRIHQLAEQTDRTIQETQARLADESQAHIDRDLTQIDVAFLKHEEAVEDVREHRFENLVAWTAERIAEHLLPRKTDGD